MKKIIILLVFITGITACKKDAGTDAGGSGIYYIKFKANGVEKKYNFAAKLADNYIDSSVVVGGKKIYSYALGGANSSGHSFSFGIYSENLLKAPATFLESDFIYNIKSKAVYIFNENPGALASVSFGFAIPYALIPIYPQYNNLPKTGKTTITEYTSQTVKGTFSCIVYQMVSNEALIDVSEKTVITDGEFYLGIQ